MPPNQRSFPNPAPQTDSARETLKSFYCTLCSKGYSRAHEFAAHESSYEHNHKQRLKDLKAMNRSMADATSGSKAEEGLVKITPVVKTGKGGAGGGFKKGGFKSAFGKDEEVEAKQDIVSETPRPVVLAAEKTSVVERGGESDTDDQGYEVYDPRQPTDCGPHCKAGR